MHKEILLECVDCGYSSNTFNLVIVGNSQGAFTYAAQCPLCDSRKIKIINVAHVSYKALGLEVIIIDDNHIQLSIKKKPFSN
jgi:Zn finger protein HypA/HybF involved in hydrogenase expression